MEKKFPSFGANRSNIVGATIKKKNNLLFLNACLLGKVKEQILNI